MLAKIIKPALREGATYFEPFIGGGAVYLEVEPEKAVIGDIVPELINCYETVRDNPAKVLEIYERFTNTEKFYYKLRNFDRNPNFYRTDRFFRSARFIFLNKCAFGACRFNQLGQANQSYFKHPERPVYLNEEDLYELHYLLKNTEIKLASFEETIKSAKEGDVVYLDPPYIDTKYDQYWIEKFKHSDMKTLKTHCDELNEEGVYFLLSHSSNEFVFKLYQEYNIVSLDTARNIKWQNRDSKRFDGEFIITNITNIPNFQETKEVVNIKQISEA